MAGGSVSSTVRHARTAFPIGYSPVLLDIGRRLGADLSLNAADPGVDVVVTVHGCCGSGAAVVLGMSGSAMPMP